MKSQNQRLQALKIVLLQFVEGLGRDEVLHAMNASVLTAGLQEQRVCESLRAVLCNQQERLLQSLGLEVQTLQEELARQKQLNYENDQFCRAKIQKLRLACQQHEEDKEALRRSKTALEKQVAVLREQCHRLEEQSQVRWRSKDKELRRRLQEEEERQRVVRGLLGREEEDMIQAVKGWLLEYEREKAFQKSRYEQIVSDLRASYDQLISKLKDNKIDVVIDPMSKRLSQQNKQLRLECQQLSKQLLRFKKNNIFQGGQGEPQRSRPQSRHSRLGTHDEQLKSYLSDL